MTLLYLYPCYIDVCYKETAMHTVLTIITTLQQGSYRQVCVKFKDFKILSYCFQGLKTYEKY